MTTSSRVNDSVAEPKQSRSSIVLAMIGTQYLSTLREISCLSGLAFMDQYPNSYRRNTSIKTHPLENSSTGNCPKTNQSHQEFCVIATSEGIDGCPTFAKAYSGFPVELAGVGELHAAFLNESRTGGCWWSPVQEIRIRGTKTMGAAQRSLSLHRLTDPVRLPWPVCARYPFQMLNKVCDQFGKSDRWAAPIIFVPRIRISCTGHHQHPRVRLSLRKAA